MNHKTIENQPKTKKLPKETTMKIAQNKEPPKTAKMAPEENPQNYPQKTPSKNLAPKMDPKSPHKMDLKNGPQNWLEKLTTKSSPSKLPHKTSAQENRSNKMFKIWAPKYYRSKCKQNENLNPKRTDPGITLNRRNSKGKGKYNKQRNENRDKTKLAIESIYKFMTPKDKEKTTLTQTRYKSDPIQ